MGGDTEVPPPISYISLLTAEEWSHDLKCTLCGFLCVRCEDEQCTTCKCDVLPEVNHFWLLGRWVSDCPEVMHFDCHHDKQDGKHKCTQVNPDTRGNRETAEKHQYARELYSNFGCRDFLELCVSGHGGGVLEVGEATVDEHEGKNDSCNEKDDVHVFLSFVEEIVEDTIIYING